MVEKERKYLSRVNSPKKNPTVKLSNLYWKFGIGLFVVAAVAVLSIYIVNDSQLPEKYIVKETSFNGLKTLVEPEIQNFEFTAEKGSTIEGEDGTLIIIPENAFLDSQGNPVVGKVDFELVEAYTMDDIILYNLTTTSDGKDLETGGMFYTNASQNGNQLTINPKRPLYIEVPTDEVKEDMMVFKGEVTSDGGINWKDPKPLEKFLVNVDFHNLDFLPNGFEERIRKEPKESMFYVKDKSQVDSLYYTIKFEDEPKLKDIEIKINVWGRTLNSIDSSFFDKDSKESSFCGINPLTIKTVKTKEFSKTLIATKEFEERIKELHFVKNGDELVKIYINNLSKDMWKIDEIIASKLTGNKKTIFERFSSKKLTNLKDSDIYQKQLSEYYSLKMKENEEYLELLRDSISNLNKQELNKLTEELNSLTYFNAQESNRYTETDIEIEDTTNSNLIQSLQQRNVANSNVYSMRWNALGWANIDRYLKYINEKSKKVNFIVKSENDYNDEMNIYQWLNAIKTLTPLNTRDNYGFALFPSEEDEISQEMLSTHTIAISRDYVNYYFGHVIYNPYLNDTIKLSMKPISIEELRIKLKSLDIGADTIAGSLKSVKEIIKERVDQEIEESRIIKEVTKAQNEKNERINKLRNKKKIEIWLKKAIIAKRKEFEKELRLICFKGVDS